MAQHGTAAVQVEIGVVGKVDHRRRVTLGGEGQSEDVVFAPFVVGHDRQLAGIAHFAVGGHILEFHGAALLAGLPHLVLEALGAAVQVIGAVVDRQLVSLAVQAETPARYAVGEAPGTLAEARAVSYVVFGLAVAQHHVPEPSFAVRHVDRHDAGTDVGQHHGCA